MGQFMNTILDDLTLQSLLEDYFPDTKKQAVILRIFTVFSGNQLFSLKVGRHIALVNLAETYVVGDNAADNSLDYMSFISDIEALKDVFELDYLDEAEFEVRYLELISKNIKTMTLDVVMWQIFSRIIKEPLSYNGHQIKLKLNYMPNLKVLDDDLPKETLQLFSYCLNSPATITELNQAFPKLSEDYINRLFLLLILSKMIDVPTLLNSLDENNDAETKKSEKNADIKRAEKTGFFQRLFQALSH